MMCKIVGAALYDHSLFSLSAQSSLLCLQSCAIYPDCKSVNYDELTKDCDLNNIDHTSYLAEGDFVTGLDSNNVFYSTRLCY